MTSFADSGSSVKVLALVSQYKKLSSKAPETLNPVEKSMLRELEMKLSSFLAKQGVGGESNADLSRRQNLRVPSNYQVKFAAVGDVQKAYIKNISGGGFFIESNLVPEIGAKISLEVLLPNELSPFTVEGVVSWTNPKKGMATPQGFGIKFVTITDSQRRMIQALVARNLEKEIKKVHEEKKK